jgi:hypothetical protein
MIQQAACVARSPVGVVIEAAGDWPDAGEIRLQHERLKELVLQSPWEEAPLVESQSLDELPDQHDPRARAKTLEQRDDGRKRRIESAS